VPRSKQDQVLVDRDYAEAIVETVQQPLVILDQRSRVLSANQSFYRVFHTTKQNTKGKLFHRIGNNQWNIPKLRHLLDEVLPKKSWFLNFEVEKEFPKIGKRVLLISGRKVIQKLERDPKILIAIEDITERRQIERQKDDFIGIASHELKTPVTSIRLYGEILRKHYRGSKDKTAADLVERMHSQLMRLNALVASFVNVYNLQTGKMKLKKSRFFLKDLVRETVGNFQYTINTHTIQQKGLFRGKVFADKRRINQVLVNLISNAIKYSPRGKKVVVTITQKNDEALVSVKDFGMGIPAEEQEKIFDRFFRVRGSREKNIPGLGLGLYISDQIVKQHHGRLWAKSVQGKGSTFYFTLPLKREAA
jgi:PAS domain S-box-containing protein